MKKTMFTVSFLLVSSYAFSSSSIHWEYSGPLGPEHWADLSPEFSSCNGKNQSPINLTSFIEAELKPISFNYSKGSSEIVNNGHTVQINEMPGNTVTLDGISFQLKQFHFHSPSENLINGKSFPLEAHLVHEDVDGNLAVIAVMFEEGKPNKGIEKAWAQFPEHEGDKLPLHVNVSPKEILPRNHDYYRYEGSLTTPPCSEGVRWIVMKHQITASKDEIEKFIHAMHHSNNRPIQPIHARTVLK